MSLWQRCILLAIAIMALGVSLGAAAASAAPALSIKARWGPTTLEPGKQGEFILLVRNIGGSDTSGPITVTDVLPPGVIASNFHSDESSEPLSWSCSGTTTVTCTNSTVLSARDASLDTDQGSHSDRIRFYVSVAPTPGTFTNTATVSGGGMAGSVTDVDQVSIGSTPASFGIVTDSFASDVFAGQWPAQIVERQAGSHPFELRVDFDLNLKTSHDVQANQMSTEPEGNLKTVDVRLPLGLIGNPEATPKCSGVDFATQVALRNTTQCPPETQVGTIDLEINNGSTFVNPPVGNLTRIPVYNLDPPRGHVADLGFSVLGLTSTHILATLDPAHGYAIKTIVPDITEIGFIRQSQFTAWGVPGDPAHDVLRLNPPPGGTSDTWYGADSQAPIKPFFTLPSDCGVDNGGSALTVDAWQNPGVFTPEIESSPSLDVEGCDDPRIRFEPKVALQPTDRAAGGPTGLDVHLEVPQKNDTVLDAADLYTQSGDVQALATPPMKKVVVTFPKGMTISTSAAQGLGNCSSDQIGLGTDRPVTCPESSRYGALTLHTPLLPKDAPMVGSIFIAKQHDNPFHNFLSMYFVIQDLERGLLIKIPGKVELDPRTGQIETTFDDLPPFPISDMELSFKGGVRAALVNPSTCGQKTITAEFFSWHEPATPVVKSSNYDVTQKADGSPCVGNLAERPFRPELDAGTVSPSAATYSPFVFRLQRTDDDQEFSQLGTTLPPGLLANISKIDECPAAGIAQAEAKGRSGGAEALFPSCPASSQIGTTDVGSGVGQVLTYIPGKAYLAGPYRGAPLSMVVITPILTGPYDLGVIAVRSAIHVNAQTAQITVQTDPFPQIFEGIPVRIRDIRVKVDRPETTINPTSCDPMAVSAHVTGVGGDLDSTADDTAADLSERFQAANCAGLPFKPKLSFRLKGGTKRGEFPALQATLRARPGDANIAKTTVTLPRSEFIEQGHIRTVCTRVQFAADQCPAGSIYGTARATSPLFDETLSGPVYLRSNGGERLLPDLVVSLNGKIEVALAGFIDSVNKGRVRNTFNVVPDAPVTKFTLNMQGGKKGLLVNHLDLCEVTSRAQVQMVGQNGKTSSSRPAMGTSCKKQEQRNHKRGSKR